MAITIPPAAAEDSGVHNLDLRRLLEASHSFSLSTTIEIFASKYAGQSHSGGMALVCLAALLLVDSVRAPDSLAGAALLLASECLHLACLQEDSFLIAYQQIASRWRTAGAIENVEWLQWLLSQPRPDTGCGLSDLALNTTPRTWLGARDAQSLQLPSIEVSAAARQHAARIQHQSIPFIHFAPPPRHTTPEEASWLDDVLQTDPCVAKLRELLLAGSQGRLPPQQAEETNTLLSLGADVVAAAAPPSDEVASLVQHNQQTAAALLAALLSNCQADEYLQVVAGMATTIPVLETVGMLVQRAAPLPSDFLRGFVTQCIASCDGTQESGAAARQIRLVCAFLTMLLREELGELVPLLPAVQAFCIQHSRNREAAQLFRRLKELESTNGAPDV